MVQGNLKNFCGCTRRLARAAETDPGSVSQGDTGVDAGSSSRNKMDIDTEAGGEFDPNDDAELSQPPSLPPTSDSVSELSLSEDDEDE